MLSAKEIVENRENPPPELPSYGVKDFEPDGSSEQSSQIEHSISEIKNIISHKNVKSLNTLSQAIWQPEINLAEVTNQTGSYWTYMGHKVGQKLYIYPEEALYLLEIGALQITYNDVPLSVQRAYFILFESQSSISIEKYKVYSLLNNNGFKVLRHSPQNSVTNYEKKLEVHKLGIKLKNVETVENTEKRKMQTQSQDTEKIKKLKTEVKEFPVPQGELDAKEFLKANQIVQPYFEDEETELEFDFDIYTESFNKSMFKKSCLQLPSYRVIVHRGDDPMPDIKELAKLSSKYKDEVPVIHAVVFPDYIATYQINPVVLPDAFD